MRMEMKPNNRAAWRGSSSFLTALRKTRKMEAIRRRYEKRPTKPDVAKKFRNSLWALL